MEPSRKLAREEVDSLLAILPADGSAPTREGPAAVANVRPYDLMGASRFSPELMLAITSTGERFAHQLTSSLSRALRTDVQATLSAVQPGPYARQCQGLAEKAIVYSVAMLPLSGRGLLAMDLALTFTCLDRLMGGPGQAMVESRRTLTDIETGLIDIALTGIAESFKEACSEVIQISPQVGDALPEMAMAKLSLPADPAIQLVVDVTVRDNRSQIHLILPGPLVQPLAATASDGKPVTPKEGKEITWRSDLRQHVEAVSIPVVAVLGTGRVSMRDLLDLHPGDVIRLDSRAMHELTIRIGDRAAYRGRPGCLGERLAVHITTGIEESTNAVNQ